MPQECVGDNIALVAVTRLVVYGGAIYRIYVEKRIGFLEQ